MDVNYPGYHIRPTSNWINDPNGMIYTNGTYHIFSQYNPNGPLWGDIHWAHFSTRDFITWQIHPIALAPSHPYDSKGCWSGCTVIDDDGTPVIIYSADDGNKRLPAMAMGDSQLNTWTKYEDNPIIDQLPASNLNGFRDHKIWKEGNTWIQLIGSGDAEHGLIYYYTSADLRDWTFKGIWYQHPHRVENMLECPDYLSIDNHKLLLFSTNDPKLEQTLLSYWAIGKEELDREPVFEKISTGLLDHDRMYAPQTLFDNKRQILIGWIREDRPDEDIKEAGWAGALSLPRRLAIEDETLYMYPVEELQQLRETTHIMTIQAGHRYQGDNLRGYQQELILKYPKLKADETIRIELMSGNQPLFEYVINSKSLLAKRLGNNKSISAEFVEHETNTIHLFFDHSILEVFVNYQECITSRMYFDNNQPPSFAIETDRVCELNCYHLDSIKITDLSRE